VLSPFNPVQNNGYAYAGNSPIGRSDPSGNYYVGGTLGNCSDRGCSGSSAGAGGSSGGKAGPSAPGNGALVAVSPHVYDSANDPHLKWFKSAYQQELGHGSVNEAVEMNLWYLICENSGNACGEGFLSTLRLMQAHQFGGEPTMGDKLVGQGAAVVLTGGGDPVWIDPKRLVFAQKTMSETFSKQGTFKGRTINEIASKLASGELTPADVPVDVVVRGGDTTIVNTRSAVALVRAGISPENWVTTNIANDPLALKRYAAQLSRNSLGPEGYGGLVAESDWGSVAGEVSGDFVAP